MSNEEPVRLKKALNTWQIFFISFSGIFGTGFLFAILSGAAYAGPAILISWIIAGAFFIIFGIVFTELGTMFPFSGSLVRYHIFSHGSAGNFQIGWAYLVGAIAGPPVEVVGMITLASAFAPYLYNSTLGILTLPGIALAIGLMGFFALVQYIGVNVYGNINSGLTILKVGVIVLMILLGLVLIFKPENLYGLTGHFSPYGYGTVFSALVVTGIVYSYTGFRQGLDFAGEAKNPSKSLPVATIWAVVVSMVLYILLQIVFIGGINWSAAGVAVGNWSGLYSSHWSANPFYYEFIASRINLLIGFALIIVAIAIISPFTAMGVYSGTAARSVYGFSKSSYLPSVLGKVDKRFRTPGVAILVMFIVGVMFLLPFPSWYLLVGITSSFGVYSYMQAGITAAVLRKVKPNFPRIFKTPVPSVIFPISFVLASMLVYWTGWNIVRDLVFIVDGGLPLFLMAAKGRDVFRLKLAESSTFSAVYWIVLAIDAVIAMLKPSEFFVYWAILSILTIGGYFYLYNHSKYSKEARALSWTVIYNVLLMIVSYFGSLGKNVLQEPWDYLVFLVISIGMYYYIVRIGFETEELKQFEKNEFKVTE
ncbi:MAG: APC family permease [Candidatus Thermoplasmatota archaeon]|jgi:amino acid transporter|nr:APC family permease [Candidatus Thermoplasmatota archaeon]